MAGLRKELKHSDITEKVVRAAHQVYYTLGNGFMEKVYENALVVELTHAGVNVIQQHPLRVHYRSVEVGEYIADLLVEGKVIVELKAVSQLLPQHEGQLVNYLKATGLNVGLLINFGGDIKVKRIVV